jgi:hypothetical protein
MIEPVKACEPSKKICESCGKEFDCGTPAGGKWSPEACIQNGCWCQEICLGSEVIKKHKEQFFDCVCPECLKLPLSPMKSIIEE